MSSQPIPYVTPEEYLKFDRSSEFRHEYVSGEIVQVAGGTYHHGLIAANAICALWNQLSKTPCRVVGCSLRLMLRRDRHYSYADATVVCGQPEFLDKEHDTLTNPKLVV